MLRLTPMLLSEYSRLAPQPQPVQSPSLRICFSCVYGAVVSKYCTGGNNSKDGENQVRKPQKDACCFSFPIDW